jgi:hypothetical protein
LYAKNSVGVGLCLLQLSHPEISISECELFFKINSNFPKGFYSFSFKMILFEFILYLK